ncbi:hypothetical protein IE077_001497 [Cardiosporidium cionae]|uniref:Peptidase C19 ubiquitin carboxyl-terminal hydrolase domain-containing protein n=1 Tax=Cardiosporidium cionae TaxID=476202 RepID=A0ABQ7JCV5_9APIC|nr:hypothetical protein IE077_001497 [Cardiosporidium cionae]|eukprot:KAF8821825.1 hypothetical protein IE077_001497 [Cardiosporidium cionae]
MADRKDVESWDTALTNPGLSSPIGDNHCFLNVVLQAFWNIRSFRRQFSTALDDVHVCQWHTSGAHVGKADEWPVSPAIESCVETPSTSLEVLPKDEAKDTVFSVLQGPCDAHRTASSSKPIHFSEFVGGLDPDYASPVYPSEVASVASSSPLLSLHAVKDDVTALPPPSTDLSDARDMCVFCMMKNLFINFAFSDCDVLPPDSVRLALSKTYAINSRFKMGDMEDADETLEALLDIFHATHIMAFSDGIKSYDLNHFSEWRDIVCNPQCIAHDVFGVELVDIPRCLNCNSLGEPIPFMSFIYRIYVWELLNLKELHSHRMDRSSPSSSSANSYENSPTSRKRGGPFKFDKSSLISSNAELSLSTCMKLLYQAERHRGVPREGMRKKYSRKFSSFLEGSDNLRAFANCEQCQSTASCVNDRYCTHYPAVFVCSLMWPANSMSRTVIEEILKKIEPLLYLHEIFVSSDPKFSAAKEYVAPRTDSFLYVGEIVDLCVVFIEYRLKYSWICANLHMYV